MKTLLVSLLLVVGALAVAQTRGTSAEMQIRQLDKQWSQAAGAKDLKKTVSFYAPDATVLPYGAPKATGTEQIRKVWQSLMSTPGFSLSFQPVQVDVAKSGDMAYEIGTFTLNGNLEGKYVVVWKKLNGQWKAAADIFNTDGPEK